MKSSSRAWKTSALNRHRAAVGGEEFLPLTDLSEEPGHLPEEGAKANGGRVLNLPESSDQPTFRLLSD
jgi:hypothetical protein